MFVEEKAHFEFFAKVDYMIPALSNQLSTSNVANMVGMSQATNLGNFTPENSLSDGGTGGGGINLVPFGGVGGGSGYSIVL